LKLRSRITAFAMLLLVSVLTVSAQAQTTRLGPTFLVNRLSNGNTTLVRYTDISWDPANRVYLVVWGAFGEILGRFVAADGTVLGTDPFVITAPGTPTDYKDAPRAAYSPDAGAFMIVWRDNRSDPNAPTVWGRSLAFNPGNNLATFLTPDFMVTGAFVHFGDVPVLEYSTVSHEFLIIYNRDYDVRGRRFNINGTLLGSEINIISTPNNVEYAWQANVTYNSADDEFLVVWRWFSDPMEAGSVQAARIKAGTDNMVGGIIEVDAPSGFDLAIPSAAYDSSNNRYLVVWYRSIGGLFTFAGRLMNANGTPAGSRFTLAPTANYVDLDVSFNSRVGSFYSVFAHHDLIDIFGTRVSVAGVPDAMDQVTVTASSTGTDYGRIAAATDRDEWMVTSNVWWNKAIAQRMGFNASGITFSKGSPLNGATDLTSPVTLTWAPVAGATYEVCMDAIANGSCDTSWQAVAGTSIAVSAPNGTYYWQVRATTPAGTAEANAASWWSLTIGSTPMLFGKQAPGNGATVGSPVTLSWGIAAGATSYQTCVDTVNDNSCNTSWQDASGISASVALGTGTYYWQVRAWVGGSPQLANNGNSFSFTVSGGVPPPPAGGGPFGKAAPSNTVAGLGENVTLQWQAVAGAGFRVCWDTTNNNSCDAAWWPNGGGNSRTLEGLAPGTYYWQVRSETSTSTTEADAGTWWSFTVGSVAPPPPPPPPPPPSGGAFLKQSPASGSTNSGSTTLAWTTASGATFYQVCYDTTNNNSCDTFWQLTATSTSLAIGGLANGAYYWQVRALINGALVDADSGVWVNFNVGSAPPPPPSGGAFNKQLPLNGSTTSSDTTLVWSAASGATFYQVCYDTTNNNSCDTFWQLTATSTNLGLGGLAPGTYYWQARALINGALVDADSGVWVNFTVGSGQAPPAPPPPSGAGFFAKLSPGNGSAGLGSTVVLQWQSLGDAGYSVCWDTTNNNICDTGWFPNGGGTSRTLTGLGTGTYYWQVRGQTGAGTSEADSGTWTSFTVGAAQPPPPPSGAGFFAKLAPGNGSVGLGSTVVLQWQSLGDAGYSVCWDTTNNNICDTAWFPNGGGTSRTLTDLGAGTYFWQVRGQTGAGTSEADSGTWTSFTVGSAVAFSKLSPVNGASGQSSSGVTLRWSSLADAGYWVCWDTSNNNVCDSTWWPNGGGTSRSVTGLAPGTYYWQVRAQTAAGEGVGDGGAWFSFTVTGLEPASLSLDPANLVADASFLQDRSAEVTRIDAEDHRLWADRRRTLFAPGP